MPGAKIEEGAYVEKAIIGLHAVVGARAALRPDPDFGCTKFKNKLCSDGISVIGSNTELKPGSQVAGNSMLNSHVDPQGELVLPKRPTTLLY